MANIFSNINKRFVILLRITEHIYFVSNANYNECFYRANKRVDISISFRKNMQYSCIDKIIDLYVFYVKMMKSLLFTKKLQYSNKNRFCIGTALRSPFDMKSLISSLTSCVLYFQTLYTPL